MQSKFRIWSQVATATDVAVAQDIIDGLRNRDIEIDGQINAQDDIVNCNHTPSGTIPDQAAKFVPDFFVVIGAGMNREILSVAQSQGRGIIWVNSDLSVADDIARDPALAQIRKAFTASDDIAETFWRSGISPQQTQIAPHLNPTGRAAPYDLEERDTMGKVLTGKVVLFAALVPDAELSLIIDAYKIARRKNGKLVLILGTPSYEQATQARSMIHDQGLVVHSRDTEGEFEQTTQVFVTDGPDETSLWMAMASAAYFGGTLSGQASLDPMTAINMGVAVLCGPNATSHRTAFDALNTASAAFQIDDSMALSEAILRITQPHTASEYAHAGWQWMTQNFLALDPVLDAIEAEAT